MESMACQWMGMSTRTGAPLATSILSMLIISAPAIAAVAVPMRAPSESLQYLPLQCNQIGGR